MCPPHRALASCAPLALAILSLFACARRPPASHPRADARSQRWTATIAITNLTPQALARVESYMSYRGYPTPDIRSEAGRTLLVFETDRSPARLEEDLAGMKVPGLTVQNRSLRLDLDTADDVAPEVAVVYPAPGEVVATDTIVVAVDVPAPDTREVIIWGSKAERVSHSAVFLSETLLKQGENILAVQAIDELGNIGATEIRVTYDPRATRIPTRVGGKAPVGSLVVVHGRKLKVDTAGHYEVTIPLPPGGKQAAALIVAPNGTRTHAVAHALK